VEGQQEEGSRGKNAKVKNKQKKRDMDRKAEKGEKN